MVIDCIKNSFLYYELSPLLTVAFDYIRSTGLSSIAAGRYDIDGCNLYTIVNEYTTKPKLRGKWEAHRRYIDLQYIIRGTERIGYGPITRMKPGPYDPEKDCLFLEGTGDFLTLREGDFMVLWPGDAHMPGIEADGPEPVKKAVFKILV
jgi:YhcH/YjgK/YiaL family protein